MCLILLNSLAETNGEKESAPSVFIKFLLSILLLILLQFNKNVKRNKFLSIDFHTVKRLL
jgi:hypothetical protein